MNKKIIITRPEGHYSLLENEDGTVLVEKNLKYRFVFSATGIVSIENAETGRVFSMNE